METGVNSELAETFPQYASELEAINNRIIDLLVPFQKRLLYTPEQMISCSIKDVLPAYFPDDPELSCKGMEIADGSDASLRYLNFIH